MRKKTLKLMLFIPLLLASCVHTRSYQIDVRGGKVIKIYDRRRFVGAVPLDKTGMLGELILFDNQ